jgi:hypothetical protein
LETDQISNSLILLGEILGRKTHLVEGDSDFLLLYFGLVFGQEFVDRFLGFATSGAYAFFGTNITFVTVEG